jgi:hypothetical protein
MLRPEAYLSLETVLRASGVSTQSPTVLTCVTPGRSGEFRAKSVSIIFRRLSRNLFWGFQERSTRYGKYNVADPEKALLDWVYLGRQEGSTIKTDELDLQRLDRGKLLQYAARFPIPVKQQIMEAVANFQHCATRHRVGSLCFSITERLDTDNGLIACQAETRRAEIFKTNAKGAMGLFPDRTETRAACPAHKQNRPAPVIRMLPEVIQTEIEEHVLH